MFGKKCSAPVRVGGCDFFAEFCGEVKGSAGESEVLDGLKMWRLQGAKIPGQKANYT